MSTNKSTHDREEPTDEQEKQSQWAKAGLAGKLQAVGSRAPDDASSDAVNNVAQLAVEFDLSYREVHQLWRLVAGDEHEQDDQDNVDATLDQWEVDE